MQANESTRINPICINAVQSQPWFGVGNDGLSRCPKHFFGTRCASFLQRRKSCGYSSEKRRPRPMPTQTIPFNTTHLQQNESGRYYASSLLNIQNKNGQRIFFVRKPAGPHFLEPAGLRNSREPGVFDQTTARHKRTKAEFVEKTEVKDTSGRILVLRSSNSPKL